MFVTVQFGDNQKEMLNPNCRIINFIHCLKEKCSLEPEECVDLIDEAGELMCFSERESSPEFASSFLKERHNYILIKVTRAEGSEGNKYEPLLQNTGKSYPDLADLLKKLSNPLKDRDKRSSLSKKARLLKETPATPQTKSKPTPSLRKNSSITYRN
ncbi:uncharacterized protein C22orf15 isoform X2 [Lepisosteus oculatus]|uniref:uncharacterized protein C22orf15 isoform X2 n=1 Tax=Lepisosteus oculatus TaxID=7918 RepID=UPI0007404CFC|nr:PREDICTED: uncharacterized protein C22orf15 homolog isoform X2 [Lepisosteus oculatus]